MQNRLFRLPIFIISRFHARCYPLLAVEDQITREGDADRDSILSKETTANGTARRCTFAVQRHFPPRGRRRVAKEFISVFAVSSGGLRGQRSTS